MRYLLIALSLLLSIELYVLSDLKYLKRAKEWGEDFVYRKEIEISGNDILSIEQITRALPLSSPAFRWWVSTSLIESELLKYPIISKAQIKSCRNSTSWRCFHLSVKEREASFLAKINNKTWILGGDGTFLVPLEVKDIQREINHLLDREVHPLVLLEGLEADENAPDLIRGRVAYLSEAISVLTSEVKRRPRTIEMTKNGELRVAFHDGSFKAVFGFHGRDLSTVGEEARRLALLLEKFPGRDHQIKEIDLAFKKVAVVRFVHDSDSPLALHKAEQSKRTKG